MEKKMTQKEIFAQMLQVKAIAENDLFRELIEKEIAQREKKSGNKKETASQKLNKEIRLDILDVLDKPMTATQIIKVIGGKYEDKLENGLTNQRLCSVLKTMINDGECTRKVEKGKAMFSLTE